MTAHAPGVLPDSISRNSRAGSWLVFVDLTAAADPSSWLRDVVTPAVATLTSASSASSPSSATSARSESESPSEADADAAAVCTVGFGSSLFDKAGTAAVRPAGLGSTLPAEVPVEGHDVVFYIFSTADAPVAAFLRTINTSSVATVQIERGYQRLGRTEVFGQPDGLRNVVPKSARSTVAFVQDGQPDEPAWATGGSYMAYLKIQQDVTQWATLDPATRAQVIGRTEDGSRVDLGPGTSAEAEEQIAAGSMSPPPNSHIRKVGPHQNLEQDAVQILRRGTPYIESDAGNLLREGLHFVSYQGDVSDFLTILQRWMLNPSFPTASTGADALFDSRQLATFLKGGIYFAVPDGGQFIGAGMCDTPTAHTGVLHLRLTVVDAAGVPDLTSSLEGATFQITLPDGAVQPPVTTNASGRATVPGLPTGVELSVTQTVPASGSGLQPPSTQPVTLERCEPATLRFVNTRTGPVGGYGAS